MRTLIPPLLALALLATPTVARADLAEEARFHDALARRHYAARRFEEAAREFMIEQRLAPNPNILFNIGLCFQQLHRREEAYTFFAEYLRSDDDDAERRRTAEAALAELSPRVALVEVTSTPPGAAVFVDRRELGMYGHTPRLLALEPGEHRIWVELEGYRPAESTVTMAVGERESVALSPEQILGRLVLTSSADAEVRVLDPEGALVWTGSTPVDTELPPGTYQVEATTGSERWSEPLVVRPEATTEATAALRGPTGQVTVTANETGAVVALDGRDRGFTPQVVTDIPVGEHALRVSLEGWRPYEGTIEIEEDSIQWVTVELVEDGETINPLTWILGGVGIAALVGGAVVTGLAARHYARYEDAFYANRPYWDLYNETRALNLAADVLWLAGGISVVAALVFLFTSDFEGRPSRATVTSPSDEGGR